MSISLRGEPNQKTSPLSERIPLTYKPHFLNEVFQCKTHNNKLY